MSASRTNRRTVTALVATVIGLALANPTAASAHPGVFDSDTCKESLTRVWSWPGELATDSGRVVLFSDAYEAYVLRQPPCDVTQMPTPRWDPGQVGHQQPVNSGPAPDVR